MSVRPLCAALLLALLPTLAAAQAPAAKPYRSVKQIVDAAPDNAWRTPDPQNVLYMDLQDGHRVIIELAPHFAPAHVGNIRTLARGGFWNGTSIYRVQDNFVAQFGDADADDPAKRKAFPAGTKEKLPAEFTRASRGLPFAALPDRDGWASQIGFSDGFPAARDPKSGTAWMAHCYGVVGAGRSNPPDSSLGAELYVIIGQSPRMLDRNLSVVGRVLRGMEWLSALPRGPEPMGMYDKPEQRVPIRAITLASELPEDQRERIQVLRTDSPAFRAAVEARRNRVDDFYKRPAGHIDLCNIAVPVRDMPAAK